MFIYIAAYFYSIQYGLEPFLWTRIGLSVFGLLIHLLFLRRLLQIQITPILFYIILIASISSLSVFMINQMILVNLSNVWLQAMVGAAFSGLLIAASLIYIEKNGIMRDLLALLRKRVG
jgi:hypothetical protein